MSLLVTETSQIIDRLALVAPSSKELHHLNEVIAFELTTLVGKNQNLDLAMTAVAAGPLKSWTSFTLGKRGSMEVRLSLLGLSLEKNLPWEDLLEISDAMFFFLPAENSQCDEFFKIQVPSRYREKPTVFLGLLPLDDAEPHGLRSKALLEWSQRNFKRSLYLPLEEGFFAKSLEWVLSF